MKCTPPPIGIILTPSSDALPSTRAFHPDGQRAAAGDLLVRIRLVLVLGHQRHHRDRGDGESGNQSLH